MTEFLLWKTKTQLQVLVRRGVGSDRLRKFFDDQDLRSDALFAYALVLPAQVSRGRMKGLWRASKRRARADGNGEELVKAALDERLILAGKEPVFQ